MRLTDLKEALKSRGLKTDGSKDTLESRLKNAMISGEGVVTKQEEPMDMNVPDYAKPMGSAFSFGAAPPPPPPVPVRAPTPTVVQRARLDTSMGSSNDTEMTGSAVSGNEEQLMYPPKKEYLPFTQDRVGDRHAHAQPPRGKSAPIMSRLKYAGSGKQRNGGVSIMDRVSNMRKGNVLDRVGGLAERGGGVTPIRDGINEPGDDQVFNDKHKLARAQRFNSNAMQVKNRGIVKTGRRTNYVAAAAAPLMEIFQEYDIGKMKDRASKYSDVPCLKQRARRFDEETANELVMVNEARAKNRRFDRFKLGEQEDSNDSSSSEEDE